MVSSKFASKNNNLISSAIFFFFMNLNSNGEGPQNWNFNLIMYCLSQNVDEHAHTMLCAEKMRKKGLDFHFNISSPSH